MDNLQNILAHFAFLGLLTFMLGVLGSIFPIKLFSIIIMLVGFAVFLSGFIGLIITEEKKDD